MIKEYRTIQEVTGPLMLIRDVENVTYDELGEIQLQSGEVRRCKVLEINGGVMLGHFAAQSPAHRAAAVDIYGRAIARCFS